ncbi:MAG: hypothetical protein M1834_000744 [Cirrosporium novae-zelandiae]|nr:MAG: hypothetical protein M1834_000744 [Cirrosporium novae-zelandiae]
MPRKQAAKPEQKPPPRYDIPYFGHEPLDPNIYPPYLSQPVHGPASNVLLSYEVNEEDEYLKAYPSDEEKPNTTPNPKPLKPPKPIDYKTVRMKGGRLAVPKKIDWNLDSEDEIIVQMKEAGRPEREIVERLKNEGRTSYNLKSIGTRYWRIKKALAAHQEEMLDQNKATWSHPDDLALLDAVTQADQEIQARIRKLQNERWKVAAEHLKKMKPTTNYSQNACRKRFETLMNDGGARG